MHYTDQQAFEIQKKWEKQKAERPFFFILVIAPAVLFAFPSVKLMLQDLGHWSMLGFMLYYLPLMLAIRRLNNCPGCKTHIEMISGRLQYCPACGVQLQ